MQVRNELFGQEVCTAALCVPLWQNRGLCYKAISLLPDITKEHTIGAPERGCPQLTNYPTGQHTYVRCFTSDTQYPFSEHHLFYERHSFPEFAWPVVTASASLSWSSGAKQNYKHQQKIRVNTKSTMICHNLHKAGFHTCH